MAGRGNGYLTGGNPEFMAKEALRKQGKDPDRLQISAVGTPERIEWDATLLKYKQENRSGATMKWSRSAACTFWGRSGTSPAASIISSGGRAGRQGIP